MQRIQLAEDLQFSRVIHGLWRLNEWNYSDASCSASLNGVSITASQPLIMRIFTELYVRKAVWKRPCPFAWIKGKHRAGHKMRHRS